MISITLTLNPSSRKRERDLPTFPDYSPLAAGGRGVGGEGFPLQVCASLPSLAIIAVDYLIQ
jgi:hypothetical protein